MSDYVSFEHFHYKCFQVRPIPTSVVIKMKEEIAILSLLNIVVIP